MSEWKPRVGMVDRSAECGLLQQWVLIDRTVNSVVLTEQARSDT
jgi:hypothetical protein